MTLALFSCTYFLYSISPIIDLCDSTYSMVVSESLLHHHSTHLNDYEFPETIAVLQNSTPPIDDPKKLQSYQLAKVNGNIVYCYPHGSAILSLPFVALMNAMGVSAATPDGKYDKAGELTIQKTLAALLMAFLACIVFRTALLLLGATPSMFIAIGLALGTQVWSTGTRSLWSHTWFIFLGGLAAYHLLSVELGRRRVRPVLLATILSWMWLRAPHRRDCDRRC